MCYRCNNFSKKIIKLKPKGVDDTVANIKIEYSATDLKNLVLKDLQEKFPNQKIELHRVNIETKSKQNYKSEWETADFRASINETFRQFIQYGEKEFGLEPQDLNSMSEQELTDYLDLIDYLWTK